MKPTKNDHENALKKLEDSRILRAFLMDFDFQLLWLANSMIGTYDSNVSSSNWASSS